MDVSPIYSARDIGDKKDYYITSTGIEKFHEKGIKGKGVTLFVLDTGMDLHSDLNIVHRADMTGEGIDRNHWHGLWVCGIAAATGNGKGILGVAPEVEVVSVKVLKSSGMGDPKYADKAIEFVMNYKCEGRKVINASIGGGNYSKRTQELTNACYKAGIPFIAASGNNGTASPNIAYPSLYENVIAVGAVDSRKAIAPFSQRGMGDIVAPGVEVIGCHPENKYISASGTSGASPFVAGLCCLLLEKYPEATVEEIYDALKETADDFGAKGYDREYYHGIINPIKASNFLAPEAPKPRNYIELSKNRIQIILDEDYEIRQI